MLSFLLAGLLSLFLVGCTQEDSYSKGEGETSMIISSVSMAGSGTKSTTTIATNGASLGVFRLAENGYTAQNNTQYTYSTGTSGWSTNSPIQLNVATASVCAYYPYGAAGITSSTDPTAVTLTSQKYDAAQDLCYATNANTLSAASPTAAFAMQRAYARLTFTITRGLLYTGTGTISSIAIRNAGILSSASFRITDGTYNSTTLGVASFNPGIASITYGETATTSILMVPVTTPMTGNLDLIFMVDGKKLTASLPVSSSGLSTLAAGNNYNINIQLGEKLHTSNCYIVAPNTSKVILVGVKGNGESTSAALGGLSTTHTAASVGVVWQTTTGLVTCTDFDASSQKVTINAGSTPGNAVIAAYSGANQTGTILWSWHIWVTSYDPNLKLNGTTYSYTPTTGITNVLMDRNLGALTDTYVNDANILHYQWGRKDPFHASAVKGTSGSSQYVDVTIKTPQTMLISIQNPFSFINGPNDWCSTPSAYFWMGTGGTDITPGVKTIYDPCPDGWRVPATRGGVFPWDGLTTGGTWGSGTTTGYTWTSVGFYPATGTRYYYDGRIDRMGEKGLFWSATTDQGSFGVCMSIQQNYLFLSLYYNKADGLSVRCVQEW